MATNICKYMDVVKKHFLDDEGKGDLAKKLEESGVSKAEAKDVGAFVEKKFKEKFKQDKVATADMRSFLKKMDEYKPAAINPKKWEKVKKRVFEEAVQGKVLEANVVKKIIAEEYNIPHLTEDIAKKLSKQAEEISALKDPFSAERKVKEALLQKNIAELQPASAYEAWGMTYPVINLLFSAKSLITQSLGGASEMAARTMEKQAAASLDWAVSLVTKQRTIGFSVGDTKELTGAYLSGLKRGAMEGDMGINTRTGEVRANVFRAKDFKQAYQKGGVLGAIDAGISNAMNQLERKTGASLSMFDEAGMSVTLLESVTDQLRLKGIDIPKDIYKSHQHLEKFLEGLPASKEAKRLGLTEDHIQEIYAMAQTEALQAGLRDKTFLAKMSKHLAQFPIIGTIINRFPTIPANQLVLLTERMPGIGLGYAAIKSIIEMKNVSKGYTSSYMFQRKMAQIWGRQMATHVGAKVLAAGLGAKMTLFGMVPAFCLADLIKPASDRREDEGNYGLRIKGKDGADYFISFSNFSNILAPAWAGSKFNELDGKNLPAGQYANEYLSWAFKQLGDGLINMPQMAVLREAFKDNHGEQPTWQDAAAFLVTRGLSQYVPFAATLRQARNMIDHDLRNTYDQDKLKMAGNEIMNGIPFLADHLPIRVDEFGNDGESSAIHFKENLQGRMLRGLNILMNPSYIRRVTNNPEVEWLNAVLESQEVGDKRNRLKNYLATRHGGKELSILVYDSNTNVETSAKVKFTAKAMGENQRIVGKLNGEALSIVASHSEDWTDMQKADVLLEMQAAMNAALKFKYGHRPQKLTANERIGYELFRRTVDENGNYVSDPNLMRGVYLSAMETVAKREGREVAAFAKGKARRVKGEVVQTEQYKAPFIPTGEKFTKALKGE